MKRLLTLPALAVLLSGCSAYESTAHVASDTSWSGSFDGRTVDGTGNQTIKLGATDVVKCASVRKLTRVGTLTLDIDGSDKKTTTAEFGVVTSCRSHLSTQVSPD